MQMLQVLDRAVLGKAMCSCAQQMFISDMTRQQEAEDFLCLVRILKWLARRAGAQGGERMQNSEGLLLSHRTFFPPAK